MKMSELEYPLRLCVEMLSFCTFSCETTQDMTSSEIKDKLAFFFDREIVEQAVLVLLGDAN